MLAEMFLECLKLTMLHIVFLTGKCSLTAGNYLLSQTDTNCRDMPEARYGYFTTFYAFKKIILDVITVKFNIQVDDRTITQSIFLHDDIPGYNLPTLEFVYPQ